MGATWVRRLPDIVHDNLARLGGNGPGVIAVSGGADSVALLRAIVEVKPDATFYVAHLNHQLRGNDSDGDADFVKQLCPHLPHFIESADVGRAAEERGENLEATARRVRYEFLLRVAKETGSAWIATAHTQDDQAETVLHRVIRGAGLRGLRGIAAVREFSGVQLIRPMLDVSRRDVLEYLADIGQAWREDSSNIDPAFTRNRIRHELLPLLRTFNPGVASALSRLSEQANEAFIESDARSRQLLQRMEKPRAGATIVLDPTLTTADLPQLREMLVVIWEREGWPRDGMTHEHWQRAADVLLGRAKAWDLPDGIRIVKSSRTVQIGPVRSSFQPAT